MLKTRKRKLALRSETIRWLGSVQLEQIDSGFVVPDDTVDGAASLSGRSGAPTIR